MPLLRSNASTKLCIAWQIEAPRTRVWSCLTRADLLRQWLGELVSGTVTSASEFVVDHGGGYCCRSTVVTYADPSSLAFTWHFPDEPDSEVALDLDGSANATELRLTHSGLGELVASYLDGWCVHLSYLEAAALATPLPPSMFWRLHSTIAQLNLR